MAEALILGCGYTGRRLARRLLEQGHRVTGSTRREERARELERAGVRPLLLDVRDPSDLRRLASEAPRVCFYLIPPVSAGGAGGGPASPLADVIRVLGRAPLDAFVYASSTSVYGDREGAWVDESDVPRPDSGTGEARLAAERTVLRAGWSHDARPRIGRIAGIYGPGRLPVEALREGRRHAVEGLDPWTNRIHVDDLARGLEAIWTRGENGRAYNLADGHPHRSSEYLRLVAEQAGLEVPVLSLREAEERYSAARLARKRASKRVSNARLREELGVELSYPTVAQGVPAAFEEQEAAASGTQKADR